MPTQVENGKAFEYAIAKAYFDFLESENIRVRLQDNDAFRHARNCYEIQDLDGQQGFYLAAKKTIETMVVTATLLILKTIIILLKD